ncbi:hypothetical protein [Litorihabitans aurantiacus]|uniref:Uncharacterized protein n=1 Tax=Litorihabitans aurantiacus TaxID=1930061 RepID=A0AA37XGK1_9MICO|nr:hypothetical protein [Litorihabitans aurantiacus]GMA32763.1 hypothetical protein GCM10025875_27550 [Litorihabitans aurantiacus]
MAPVGAAGVAVGAVTARVAVKSPSAEMSTHWLRMALWYCAGTWVRTDSARAHFWETTLRLALGAPAEGFQLSAKAPRTT